LGERLLCKQEVTGSNPVGSTREMVDHDLMRELRDAGLARLRSGSDTTEDLPAGPGARSMVQRRARRRTSIWVSHPVGQAAKDSVCWGSPRAIPSLTRSRSTGLANRSPARVCSSDRDRGGSSQPTRARSAPRCESRHAPSGAPDRGWRNRAPARRLRPIAGCTMGGSDIKVLVHRPTCTHMRSASGWPASGALSTNLSRTTSSVRSDSRAAREGMENRLGCCPWEGNQPLPQ
jgi:hypothetical protein